MRATVGCLTKIGVTFAPANGRQYYKVLEQFEPISRNFMYIAENGAFVIKDGEVIVRDCLSGAVALDVIKRTRKLPSVYPILCCEDCAYIAKVKTSLLGPIDSTWLGQLLPIWCINRCFSWL